MDRLKALVLVDWDSRNGFSLVDELRKNSIDCDLMGTNFKLKRWTPFKKYLIHWPRCFWVSLRAFWRRGNYDWVIAWQQIMGIYFGLFKRLSCSKSPKLFLPITNIMQRKNRIISFIRKKITTASWKAVDKIGFFSVPDMERVVSDYDLPAYKAVHLPFGINLKKFPSDWIFNLDSYICSVGISYRDYETIIKAAEKIDRQFVIVTQQFALKGLKIPDNVLVYTNTFGRKTQEIMLNASIIVLTFKFENCPAGENCILEAMWYGKPLIVTRTITSIQYIDHGVNGLYVPLKNPEAVVEAINYILSNPAKAKDMGYRARRSVEKNYSMEVFGTKVAKIILNERI